MSNLKTREIKLGNGSTIFVEVEEVDIPAVVYQQSDSDLPEGAEPVSMASKAHEATEILKSTLQGVLDTVHQGIQDAQPDEWGVELSIGFKGTTNLIPVIVSGEGNVALKVHAKWKR